MKDPVEKRHYQSKPPSDIVNFPVNLRRSLLSPAVNDKVLDMPISSARILFKILNDISNDQFQASNVGQLDQLSLFEQEFKTEHNTYARFTFKVADITSKKNYDNIKRGLEFLENLNKGWYKSLNKEGKTIKSYGGVISNANISDGNISFLVSAYWLESLLSISRYNAAFMQTAWVLSKTKQVLFYLWLLEVPDTGTKVNFKKFQETYQYNYSDAKTYAKNVLRSIKTKLDKFSNKSFNYSVKGDFIFIQPYYTKDVQLRLKKQTSNNQKLTQKLHYWKIRHKLTANQISVIRDVVRLNPGSFSLLLKSYNELIKSCRTQGIKATTHEGEAFLTVFQEHIIKVYKVSTPGSIKRLEKAWPHIY